jgi:hypothetical protein
MELHDFPSIGSLLCVYYGIRAEYKSEGAKPKEYLPLRHEHLSTDCSMCHTLIEDVEIIVVVCGKPAEMNPNFISRYLIFPDASFSPLSIASADTRLSHE